MKRKDVIERLGGARTVGRRSSASVVPDGAAPDDTRRGDHDLNPGSSRRSTLTPAAVLVPLVDHGDELSVIFTQRTDHLYDHAGQISFPGGRVDAGDADAVAAALRETEEEVGIPGDRIEVLGRLDDYETGTGFLVVPVVGVLAPGYPVAPDPFEVADVFEVPLSFILDPANHGRESRIYEGVERFFYVLPFEDRYIWGATAGMLINLYEVLSG